MVLAVGQSADVARSTAVTVERVVGDSRCPIGVTCAWAGEVEIAFSLSSPSGAQAFELSDRSDSATVQGFGFKLLSVEPHPRANTPIAVGDYRVSVQVSKD